MFDNKDQWVHSAGFFETEEEEEQNEGKVANTILTYIAFRYFWKGEFHHVRFRSRGADTCTDCFKIRFELRHLVNRKLKLEEKMEEADKSEGVSK